MWIPDPAYTADLAIEAELFWVGDQRATPEPIDATASLGPQSLLRVRITLASGEVVSRIWAWAELVR